MNNKLVVLFVLCRIFLLGWILYLPVTHKTVAEHEKTVSTEYVFTEHAKLCANQINKYGIFRSHLALIALQSRV